MSNTGVYKWDSTQRKVVKIGDKPRGCLTLSDVTFTRPYWTPHISGKPEFIDSKFTKKRLMEAHGVRELSHSKEHLSSSNHNRPSGCSPDFVAKQLKQMRGPFKCLGD